MAHRWLVIHVRGRTTEYQFPVWADDKYLDEWRGDGLNIDYLLNTVPQWAQQLGLTKIWCRLQDRGIISVV